MVEEDDESEVAELVSTGDVKVDCELEGVIVAKRLLSGGEVEVALVSVVWRPSVGIEVDVMVVDSDDVVVVEKLVFGVIQHCIATIRILEGMDRVQSGPGQRYAELKIP